MGEVTKQDLFHVEETLSAKLDSGFERTHARLDVMNGRVGKSEVNLGRHDVRLRNVEREVFHRRRDDRDEYGQRRADVDGDTRRITQRDVNVAIAAIGGAAGLIGFLWKVLPVVIKAVVP